MKKMPSLFVRDWDQPCPATSTVEGGCQWVLDGEGVAHVKRDGTATMVRDGVLFRRFDRKLDRNGTRKPAPEGFEPLTPEPLPDGHWTGWVPVMDGPHERWFNEAFARVEFILADGTYELCGPHFNANKEELEEEVFIGHDSEPVDFPCGSYGAIKEALAGLEHEGVVWHHPDGRMCKVKRSDFGLDWPIRLTTKEETK